MLRWGSIEELCLHTIFQKARNQPDLRTWHIGAVVANGEIVG